MTKRTADEAPTIQLLTARSVGARPSHPRAGACGASTGSSFFLADAQMGFGPLVAVYLTAQK